MSTVEMSMAVPGDGDPQQVLVGALDSVTQEGLGPDGGVSEALLIGPSALAAPEESGTVVLTVSETSVDVRRGSITDTDPARYESLSPAGDVFRKVLDRDTREVIVESDIGLRHYDELAAQLGPWAERDMAYLRQLAVPLQGKIVEEVNPTANGGGVQMILMAQINALRELGVIDRWRLMVPNLDAFRVTKDWHNTFQGVAHHSPEHIEAGKTTYEAWITEENLDVMRGPFSEADIVTIHDPQPHELIPYVQEWNPDAEIAWRSHIQNRSDLIGTPGTPQEQVWNYVFNGKVDQARVHVFHPVDAFVPHNVPEATVKFAPATFDPFDDLNRLNLTETEKQEGRDFIDGQLAISRILKPLEAPAEEDWNQTEMDWDRPIMALIARFDPSKGMPNALEAYVRARKMMIEQGIPKERIPQFVALGNGSIDDPDGEAQLALMMTLRSQLDDETKQDVKIIRVPHNDKAINTLMTEAEIGLQPSLFEGFETRASDWIWHGKPVIVSNRGGLPLQVHDGKSGHIVDPEDTEQFAKHMFELSTNPAKYDEMARWAEQLGKTYNYREFSTVANSIRWLEVYGQLLDGNLRGGRRWRISEIVDGEAESDGATSQLHLGSLAATNAL